MSSYGVFSTNLARILGISRKFRIKKIADNIRIERPSNDTITAKVITALDDGLAKKLLKLKSKKNERIKFYFGAFYWLLLFRRMNNSNS